MFNFGKKIQRLKTLKVRAVYDSDLIIALEKLNLLEKIKKGGVRCTYTGVVITLDNLHAIIRTDSGFEFISEDAVIKGLSIPE